MSASPEKTPPAKSPLEQLHTPVQFLKGVGPQRAELLHKLGLRTAADLLFFFPRDYQDMSELVSLADLVEDQMVSVTGTVEEVDMRNTGTGRTVLGVLVKEGREHLRAIWFNQPFMRDRFAPGQRLLLSGKTKQSGLRWEMVHPRVEWLDADDSPPAGRVLPIYSLTEGINQGLMRKIVQQTVESHVSLLEEILPTWLREQYELLPIHEALAIVHTPPNHDALARARRRFIFQELLVLQLALALRKQTLTTGSQATPLPVGGKIDARIRRLFPFPLTADQEQVINEIAGDLARSWPMNRLLHGEVGSGKTVIAVYAMLVAVAHKHQAALMAPTEVLARQHMQTLERMLRGSSVRLGLLTGSLTASERRETLAAIAAAEIDVVVGTHAIVQEGVEFAKLGLVVIDEQHKFGVRQRAKLRQHGLDPHYLVMTATPIPRTVAMTQFGDLDISTLRSSPPGRQEVHTYLADEAKRERWWEFFRNKLREGRQGYVVAPLVDESSELEVDSVAETFENLTNGELADFRIDLIHGRMSAAEKDAVMQRFREGQTQVLVATSVVEVGVDVANATVMTIFSGQRFGLAQLHQLRGRVSRGQQPGYVCVFADTESEAALARLDAFLKSTNGFELAELDYQLRGPGDLLGTRQHGLPPLRIADLSRDVVELDQARAAAQTLVADAARWSQPDLAALRKMVESRYGKAFDLGDVG